MGLNEWVSLIDHIFDITSTRAMPRLPKYDLAWVSATDRDVKAAYTQFLWTDARPEY